MAIAQLSEHFHVGKEATTTTLSADELALESGLWDDLARLLISHIAHMRATGYHNEIVVDGEVWIVQAKRISPGN